MDTDVLEQQPPVKQEVIGSKYSRKTTEVAVAAKIRPPQGLSTMTDFAGDEACHVRELL